MSFAIIRTKKLKSIGAVVRSGKHTFREQLTPNADPGMTSKNKVVGAASAEDLKARLQLRLPEKIKGRSVLCIEYLITASPSAFKRHGGKLDDTGNGYFSDALRWLQQRHGRENVICAAVHLDETTPHLVAYVVPMTADHRLSCRDFLGGKAKLKQLQTDFHTSCGKKQGLERGVEGSTAKHQDIKKFYAALSAAGGAPKLEAKDYAAAAIGIKTAAWRRALAIAEANAKGIAALPSMKQALERRSKFIGARTAELDERMQIIKHRQLLLSAAEQELVKRSESISERERQIRLHESKVETLEAERDALERRLEILEEKTENRSPRSRKLHHCMDLTL
ncbi:MobV family relaxase [Pseudomonas psychrophila]|uniref:MobV family relaxase n=1 Tax=Pseudomonas psychrophila TaxID=122355 RepID=UPI0003573B95|nr:MobV family relaxase [Pseudomonas psychrophila]EPJ92147.1 Mob [Pseudomonas psychrophila]